MKSIIVYYLTKLIFISLAPLYFHFGQAAWLLDLNSFLLEMTDITAIFFIFFIFLSSFNYLKNLILTFLLNKTFSHYSFKNFTLPFTNFFNQVWVNLKNFFSKK